VVGCSVARWRSFCRLGHGHSLQSIHRSQRIPCVWYVSLLHAICSLSCEISTAMTTVSIRPCNLEAVRLFCCMPHGPCHRGLTTSGGYSVHATRSQDLTALNNSLLPSHNSLLTIRDQPPTIFHHGWPRRLEDEPDKVVCSGSERRRGTKQRELSSAMYVARRRAASGHRPLSDRTDTSQHGQASSTPAPPQPHRQRSQQPLLRPLPSGGSVVVVVSHHAIGVARARSRFFGALFWAIIIYLVAGLAVPIALFSITSKSY